MDITTDMIRRALKDPAYMTTLATHLIETGEIPATCARQDYHLTPQHTALLADDPDLTPRSWCLLHPHHPGPHHALLHYLTHNTALWITWHDPHSKSELLPLTDCPHSTTPDHACPLYTGHPGPCPTPRLG
ncbi:hypothetical protein ACIQNU_20580 [Streptomyces sp. NPDC091292]|uniref:hypothetical protein n=1 Tax=Streptomyces sp. NPDC091292 TaxID=3365991 RepID=UPI00381525B9